MYRTTRGMILTPQRKVNDSAHFDLIRKFRVVQTFRAYYVESESKLRRLAESQGVSHWMFSILMTGMAGLLWIPFVGWGVYVLRLQYKFHEELRPTTKWVTAVAVLLFVAVELSTAQVQMRHSPGLFMLTMLALLASTTALYGHLFVSMASQLLVDMIHPDQDVAIDQPDYAAAEALEQVGDYEGALSEYLVMARIFPGETDCVLKVAEAFLKVDKSDQAVIYFEKALARTGQDESAFRVTNRLSGVYQRNLDQPDEAKEVLHRFIERFPHSSYVESAERRLRMMEPSAAPKPFKSVTDLLEPPPSDLLG